MTDGQLLERYAADRDADSFAELVRRHGGMVHAAAKRLARNDAEDVTQAVFLLLAQRAGKLAHYRNVAGWLYGVARYCAANARRTSGRRERNLQRYRDAQREAAMTQPTSTRDDSATNELLDAALTRLKEDQRQAVLLRYIEGLSLEESAERLGVNAAAVAKRAERGIARLREYFHARGVSFSDAALAASPISAPLLAQITGVTSSGGAGGAVALATATKQSMAIVTAAKVAAVLIFTAGAAITTVGVVRRAQPASAVASPIAAATRPAASSPTTLTQESGRAAAAAFVRALRDRDEPAAASALIASSPNEARAAAAGFIAQIRDGLYASYPQRLDQVSNSLFETDNRGVMIRAALDCPPPTDADVRRLSIRLRPQGGVWRVSDVLIINGTVGEQSPRPLPPVTAPTNLNVPPGTYARAAEQFARFQSRMAFESDAAKLDAQRARVSEMLKLAQQDIREIAQTLRPTDLAIADADVERVNAWLERARATLERQGAAAFIKLGETAAKEDKEFVRASQKVWGLGQTLNARADAETNVVATTRKGSRPRAFGEAVTVTLPWEDGRAVKIDGPVTIPNWFRESSTFKAWQKRHDIQTFRTTDDDGNLYVINCSGGTTDAEGNTRDWIPHVSLFRADGTLAASADFGMAGHATSWGTFDKSGLAYTRKVVTERANGDMLDDTPPRFAQVISFDAQKNQRVWEIGEGNVAKHEVLKDPIGTPIRLNRPRGGGS